MKNLSVQWYKQIRLNLTRVAEEPPEANVRVRLPDGERVSRRFTPTQQMEVYGVWSPEELDDPWLLHASLNEERLLFIRGVYT
jgi:hypothetical protein